MSYQRDIDLFNEFLEATTIRHRNVDSGYDELKQAWYHWLREANTTSEAPFDDLLHQVGIRVTYQGRNPRVPVVKRVWIRPSALQSE